MYKPSPLTKTPTSRLTTEERAGLEEAAYRIRRLAIETVAWAQWGHIGGSLSMAEILATLFWRELVIDPTRPDWSARDRLVLSKAHASPGLYAAMALRGFFPVNALYEYCEIGGILDGHADASRTPGLESSGGLLGMGLSVAQGMAIGLRMQGLARSRVYCLLGDGELNEGNVWEAVISALHYRLDNLIAIIDRNKVMAKDLVAEQMEIEPVAAKFAAFGWTVLEVDGHDLDALAHALYQARWVAPVGGPVCVIAHTVKGRGILEAENTARWHTHAPDPDKADAMLRELSRNYGKAAEGYSHLAENTKTESLIV